MSKNPRNTINRIEAVQGLIDVGIEIGAIVVRESFRNTAMVSRFMARQGMGALRTSLEMATQATDNYGLNKRLDEYAEGSIKQAMGEAVEAVGQDPQSTTSKTKMGVFASKLGCAHDLVSEVRIVVDDPGEPDIIIPTDTIKEQYLKDFGDAVKIKGVHPDDAQHYKAGLREPAGMEVYSSNLV